MDLKVLSIHIQKINFIFVHLGIYSIYPNFPMLTQMPNEDYIAYLSFIYPHNNPVK